MKSKLWRIPHLLLWAGLLLVIFTLPALAQINPVPLINQPLVPDAVAPGGPAFTLTVNGTGFVSSSVVNWNGSQRVTTYGSSSQLTAAITVADIANAGTASVTVVNPTPGGGTSNVAFLSITNPTTTAGAQLAPDYIYRLSILATSGLAIMWATFWLAVWKRGENVRDILSSTGFFRTVAVMGVVAATVVLSLAGRLEGNITGAILSGIVGYVLGQLSGRGHGSITDEKE